MTLCIKLSSHRVISAILLSAGIFFSSAVSAADAPEKFDFAVFDIKAENCPAEIGRKSSSLIKKRLSSKSYFKVISDASSTADVKKKYPEGVIVSGTVTGEEVKQEGQVSRYATEDLLSKRYILSVSAYNLKTGKTDFSVKQTYAGTAKLEEGSDLIGKQIHDLYSRKIAKPAAPVKDTAEKSSSSFGISGFSVLPSFLKPLGSLKDYFSYGYGLGISIDGTYASQNTLYTGIKLSAYNIKTKSGSGYSSAQRASADVQLGYRFSPGRISFTPYLDGGYSIHSVKVKSKPDAAAKKEMYFNPSAGAGLILAVRITEKTHIALIPEFGMLFEKDRRTQFAVCALGLNWRM